MDISKQQNAVAVEDGAPPGKDAMDTGGERNWLLILAGPVVAFVLTLLLPGSLTFEARAIAGIAIWMPFESRLFVGLFDLFLRRVARHAKNLVKVCERR